MMRCVLVALPFQDPSSPPLGVALLSAALAEAGLPHRVVDANLDFLAFVEKGSWGPHGPWPPFLPASAQSAAGYLDGFRRQQEMFEHLSRTTPDYVFSQYLLSLTAGWPDLEHVRRAALAPQGIWEQWLDQASLLNEILAQEPAWVGLSVNFEGQLPAALALGRRLKRDAGVTVVWGGGLMNAFAHALSFETPIWDCVDGIILGAGENPSCRMVRAADGGVAPLGAVRSSEGRWIMKSTEMERCRRPNFDLFTLDRYRAADVVLPYRVFAGCHWRRCAFCADARYRFHENRLDGDAGRIAEELAELTARHSALGVGFLDAELPVDFMLQLAEELRRRDLPLRWGGNSRLAARLAEPGVAETLFRGGCRFLRFGLESGSDEVLRLMNKGTTVAVAEKVIRAVSAAGIGVHVFLMHGFPGEKPDDLARTEDFLRLCAADIDSCNISPFELYEGSPLALRLSGTDIVRTAAAGYWSYPAIPGAAGQDWAARVEAWFYAGKSHTRCFPTLADSILLAERFTLSYAP